MLWKNAAMDWELLFAFLCAARAGSLLDGARLAGVDRSTLSRRLGALERRFKLILFLRTRDGLELTAAGRRVLVDVEAMEEAAQRLHRQQGGQGELTGVVRVATTEALGPFLLEEGLLDVTAQHPGLRVDVLTGNTRVDLSRGEAELAVRLAPLKGPGLTVRCLARMPVGLFAAESYLASRPTPRTPEQLAGHLVLLPALELEQLPEVRWLARQSGLTVALASNNFPTLMTAAVQGRGIVPTTIPWGERLPGLKLLMPLPRVPPRTLWLVRSQTTRHLPAVDAVARHLDRLFRAAVSRPGRPPSAASR